MTSTGESTATADGTVVSRDGTTIAYERSGDGPPLILVASALADRSDTRKLAALLARHFTVVNYDRRGRGRSEDSAEYAVRREVEDIEALIRCVGGSASVFGSSSGAVLALRAAAAGLGVERLALYEPPFAVTDDGFGPPPDFAAHIDRLIADGQRGAAVRAFMTKAQGMPAFVVATMRLVPPVWSKLKALAPTLPYDIAVMGDTQRGRPLAAAEWAGAGMPTLILTGGKSPAGFQDAARELGELLPDATRRTLPGLNHGAVVMAPKKVAPSLVEFLRS